MIKLERGSKDNFSELGTFYSLSEIVREINKILAKEKIENFIKVYELGDGYIYNDYGSYTDFFRYKEVPDEEEKLVKIKKGKTDGKISKTDTGKRKRKKD